MLEIKSDLNFAFRFFFSNMLMDFNSVFRFRMTSVNGFNVSLIYVPEKRIYSSSVPFQCMLNRKIDLNFFWLNKKEKT